MTKIVNDTIFNDGQPYEDSVWKHVKIMRFILTCNQMIFNIKKINNIVLIVLLSQGKNADKMNNMENIFAITGDKSV